MLLTLCQNKASNMVSEEEEESPTNTHSSILHQFIINATSSMNQLGTQQYFNPAYPSDHLSAFDSHGSLLQEGPPHVTTNESNQRLSLSLSNWSTLVVPPQRIMDSALMNNASGYYYCSSGGYNGTDIFPVNIGNSKFLRPAQLLLDEVVKVNSNSIDLRNEKYARKLSCSSKRGSLKLRSQLNTLFSNIDFCEEKHGLHTQLLKLVSLLEEVERRYEEYHHQIDELVTSFECIAGLGAGKSYTALTLNAMFRHFFSLRDAILSQISATKQKLSSNEPIISNGISQLSLFEHEKRRSNKTTSLQHIGLIHNSRQVWRAARGLPDTSVSILRSWLFEHFLHPYPTDYEKLMLSSQTGLNKNQVSNWFINARVRLWKPMIEEMYKEEFADSSVESNPSLTQEEGFGDSAEDKTNFD